MKTGPAAGRAGFGPSLRGPHGHKLRLPAPWRRNRCRCRLLRRYRSPWGGNGTGGVARSRTLRHPPSQPLSQFHDLSIRRQVQLLADQSLIHPGMLKRARQISGLGQGLHQTGGDLGVQRIKRREAPQPSHRRAGVPACPATFGQLAEEVLKVARQRATLLFHPALEGIRARQVEALQERPSINLGGTLQIARRKRAPEFNDVRGDQFGIEPKVLQAQETVIGSEVTAEGIERLREGPSAALFIGVGPEMGEQIVPGHAPVASHRQQCQQGKPSRLSGRAAQQTTLPGHVQPT